MPHLDLLRQHRRALASFLEDLHRAESNTETKRSPGIHIAVGIYRQVLQDAISILDSIIHHLEPLADG